MCLNAPFYVVVSPEVVFWIPKLIKDGRGKINELY